VPGRVPATEAEVEAAHEADCLVDHAHLLVLSGHHRQRAKEPGEH
jgi:hypothetical protein